MVYSARSSTIYTVVIDGRVVLEARWPTQVDSHSVFADVQRSVGQVFDRMGYRVQPRPTWDATP
jgi:hypothetical protein